LNFADSVAGGATQQKLRRTLFQQLAERWADWWAKNWRNYLDDEADAQLELTKTSLAKSAESIAKLPRQPNPTEIPCGPKISVGDGTIWNTIEPYLDLDTGRSPPQPAELIKNSPKDNPSPKLLAWAEREGVDLLRVEIQSSGGDAYYGFKPVGMKVWRIDNDRFKNLEKELHESKNLDLPALWEGPISSLDPKTGAIDDKKPASYLFITKEGSCGAMQIRSAAVHDMLAAWNAYGPTSFEYKFIYESEPEKPSPTEVKP
jgi:hypothetical protein